MKNFLINHFEKIILGIVVIICLFMITGSVNQYLSRKEEQVDVNELKERIQDYINTENKPDLEPIPAYTDQLTAKLEGERMSLLNPAVRDVIYPPEFPKLIKIVQKPRFSLLRPVPDSINTLPGKGKVEDSENPPMGAAASYMMVKVKFKTDDKQQTGIENKFSNTFKGSRAVVAGAVLQRRLVHDGRKAVNASAWKTLSGPEEDPVWKKLDNPASTTFILKPLEGKRGTSRSKGLVFLYFDTGVKPFRTYEYRFALLAGIQEGIRLFKRAVTPQDRAADRNAVFKFDPDMYDSGERFSGNEVFEAGEMGADDPLNAQQNERSDLKKNAEPAPAGGRPFYKVISGFSNEFKATAESDCEIHLASQMADQVSVFILKHFQYTVKLNSAEKKTGDPEVPIPGGALPIPDIQSSQQIKEVFWADLVVSFLHSKDDRIGREQAVKGHKFVDNKNRTVDFTTPFRLLRVGRSDRRVTEQIVKREMDEQGRIIEKKEIQKRIKPDVLYADVENIYTGKRSRIWRTDQQVVRRIKREAAEQLQKERERFKNMTEKQDEPEPEFEPDEE